MKTRKEPTGATLSVDSIAMPPAKLQGSGRNSSKHGLAALLPSLGKRSGTVSPATRASTTRNRERSVPLLRGVTLTLAAERATAAVHFTATTVERMAKIKRHTVGQATSGRLTISQAQVRERLRQMLLLETGYDLDDLPEDGVFPARISQNTRVGLQVVIQSSYFCEVKCRVGVKALQAACTPSQLVEAIWTAIPRAHRAPAAAAAA